MYKNFQVALIITFVQWCRQLNTKQPAKKKKYTQIDRTQSGAVWHRMNDKTLINQNAAKSAPCETWFPVGIPKQTDALKWKAAVAPKLECLQKYSPNHKSLVYIHRPQPNAHTGEQGDGSVIWLWCKKPRTTGWHQWGLPQSTMIWHIQFCENSESLLTAVSHWIQVRSKYLGVV